MSIDCFMSRMEIRLYTYVRISGRVYFLNLMLKEKCQVTTCHLLAYLEDDTLYLCVS